MIDPQFRDNQRLKDYAKRVDYGTFVLEAPLADLGYLLLARTERGLCVLLFVGEAGQAEGELGAMMPRAWLVQNQGLLAPIAEQVTRLLINRQPESAIVLDIFGTPFQQQVWKALLDIPAGEQSTYGDLARHLRNPKASRAVGAACGANTIALLVPCHRVVGDRGSLTGYRWGIERKQRLLEHERQQA